MGPPASTPPLTSILLMTRIAILRIQDRPMRSHTGSMLSLLALSLAQVPVKDGIVRGLGALLTQRAPRSMPYHARKMCSAVQH